MRQVRIVLIFLVIGLLVAFLLSALALSYRDLVVDALQRLDEWIEATAEPEVFGEMAGADKAYGAATPLVTENMAQVGSEVLLLSATEVPVVLPEQLTTTLQPQETPTPVVLDPQKIATVTRDLPLYCLPPSAGAYTQVVGWLKAGEQVEIIAYPTLEMTQLYVAVATIDPADSRKGWVPLVDLEVDRMDASVRRNADVLMGCWGVPFDLSSYEVPGQFFGATPYDVVVPVLCQASNESGIRFNMVYTDAVLRPVLILASYKDWYYVKAWPGFPELDGADGFMLKEHVETVLPISVRELTDEEAKNHFYECLS